MRGRRAAKRHSRQDSMEAGKEGLSYFSVAPESRKKKKRQFPLICQRRRPLRNNNHTKRRRFGVSWDPLTFVGPYPPGFFSQEAFGLALHPGRWLAAFARG